MRILYALNIEITTNDTENPSEKNHLDFFILLHPSLKKAAL